MPDIQLNYIAGSSQGGYVVVGKGNIPWLIGSDGQVCIRNFLPEPP